MFTGLVQDLGKVEAVNRRPGNCELLISSALEDVSIGDSIAVNGVCLTVTSLQKQKERGSVMSFDVSGETLSRTNIGELKAGDPVNLEPAMKLSDRLGGHLVSGHIDGLGRIREKRKAGDSTEVFISVSDRLMRYIVEKGSVAVDGISLTVVKTGRNFFSVVIIPHTAEVTTIGIKEPGDTVNIETDIIGKYVEKMLNRERDDSIMDKLRNSGFL